MRLLALLCLLCACSVQSFAVTLTFEEFSIDAGHPFIDISDYYNGGFAFDASGPVGPGPNYGLSPYPGTQFIAFGGGGDNGLRIPTFNGPGGFIFKHGITGSFSFVSAGDPGHNALLVSAVDANGKVLAEDFAGNSVGTFTLRFKGVAAKILLGAPDANNPGPLDVPGFWIFDNVTFTPVKEFPAVWRPSNGIWYVLADQGSGGPQTRQWGLPGDVPVPGDYDGDGQSDFAVWRPSNGTWYIIPSGNPAVPIVRQWGLAGDVPLAGDFDGDKRTDFAVWRPSSGTWLIVPSANPNGVIVQQWGISGDVPLSGDFDGDGKTDLAVWRPSSGTWYIIPSSQPGQPIAEQWGLNGDVPISGDFDGDAKADLAVWRPTSGTWYIIPSSNPGQPMVEQWGLAGDIPVSADFDGDGKTDLTAWRPASGTWFIVPSMNTTTPIVQQWGLTGDIPVGRAPLN
jgi:hypothetical protein